MYRLDNNEEKSCMNPLWKRMGDHQPTVQPTEKIRVKQYQESEFECTLKQENLSKTVEDHGTRLWHSPNGKRTKNFVQSVFLLEDLPTMSKSIFNPMIVKFRSNLLLEDLPT